MPSVLKYLQVAKLAQNFKHTNFTIILCEQWLNLSIRHLSYTNRSIIKIYGESFCRSIKMETFASNFTFSENIVVASNCYSLWIFAPASTNSKKLENKKLVCIAIDLVGWHFSAEFSYYATKFGTRTMHSQNRINFYLNT